jgi:hypothetical protein
VEGQTHMLQLLASNLLKASMAGSNTTLGLWGLDEYLVLPRHRSISYEVNHGCLTQLHDPTIQEARLPCTLALPLDDLPDGPDILEWRKYGSFESAIRSMRYTAQPVKACCSHMLCKAALVSANSDFDIHMHRHVRPLPDVQDRSSTDQGCAYVHNFYRLWRCRRQQWPDLVFSKRKAPVVLEDMFASL